MSLHDFTITLLVGAVLLLVAVVAVRFSERAGVPTLLGYLAIGVALGESGLGVRFDDAQLAQNLGLAALVLILAEGGVTAHWPSLRRSLPVALRLSTIGVAVSIGVVAVAGHLLLGLPWETAVVLGAILAPTDAAAVFATLRGLTLRRNLGPTLEAESGTNDPIVVVVVLGIAGGGWAESSIALVALDVVVEMSGGLIGGFLVARAGSYLLRRAAPPAPGLYPLAVVALVVMSYAGTAALHASGFLAAYVTAVLLGRDRLPHRQTTLAFFEGLGWLAQIGLFVMLGLLVSPSELPEALLPALVIGLILALVARPLAVVVATFRAVRGSDQVFLSWGGLRGAVPIILATIPLTHDMPDAEFVFNIVFVLVVVFTALQGRTLPLLARVLRVEETALKEVRVESAPLDRVDADLLQIRVPAGSKLHGVTVRALRLPDRALVSLIVREGAILVPESTMRIRTADELLIVAPSDLRDRVERRLRAVSRRGQLADWLGEHGDE